MKTNAVSALAAVLLSALLISVSNAGEIKGKISYGGKTVDLKCVYALQYNNEEGMDRPELRIAVTDREIPIDALSGPLTDALETMSRNGKVTGLLLKLDPTKLSKAGINGTILYPPKDQRRSLPFFTVSGTGTGFEISRSGDQIKGKVKYQFKGQDLPSFDFEMTLSVPVVQDKVTAKLTGPQALNSPQLKTLLAYQAALLKGDLNAARKMATAERFAQIDSYVKQVGRSEMIKMLKSEPDAAAIKKQVKEIFLRGRRAYIIMRGAGEKSVQRMIQAGKEWKVD